jgi:uncharacterized protein YdhG (YjbR/CyaY superfamily)
MSSAQVDEYLAALEEPKRGTLQTLRRTILEVVPEADQVISYGVPALRLSGPGGAGLRRCHRPTAHAHVALRGRPSGHSEVSRLGSDPPGASR